MNWNKCLRIAIQCILLTTLATVTFIQFLKYMEGNTNISISYEERDLNLPSLTICPRYEGTNERQRNITFDDYMKGVLNMSEIFDYVYQYNYLPGESLASSQITKDFLENNRYWKNSYYLAQFPNIRLIPCWTLDLNETTVSKPMKSIVMTLKIVLLSTIEAVD